MVGQDIITVQVRRPRRRPAQPDRQRLLLRARRLVPGQRAQRPAARRTIPSFATSASSRNCGCSIPSTGCRPCCWPSVSTGTGACSGWRGVSCCPRQPSRTPPSPSTPSITSTAHRRFDTVDESRNNVITALFAAGEGWRNNHHRYQRSARNGFYWWEFDPTWYVIRAMSLVGLAWDVQPAARAHLPRGSTASVPRRVSTRRRWTPRRTACASPLNDGEQGPFHFFTSCPFVSTRASTVSTACSSCSCCSRVCVIRAVPSPSCVPYHPNCE